MNTPHRAMPKFGVTIVNDSQASHATLHYTSKQGLLTGTLSVRDIAPEDIDILIDQLLQCRKTVLDFMESTDQSPPGAGLLRSIGDSL